eukprot:Selendium_serpulae@DN5412_c0_g1_i1.p1
MDWRVNFDNRLINELRGGLHAGLDAEFGGVLPEELVAELRDDLREGLQTGGAAGLPSGLQNILESELRDGLQLGLINEFPGIRGDSGLLGLDLRNNINTVGNDAFGIFSGDDDNDYDQDVSDTDDQDDFFAAFENAVDSDGRQGLVNGLLNLRKPRAPGGGDSTLGVDEAPCVGGSCDDTKEAEGDIDDVIPAPARRLFAASETPQPASYGQHHHHYAVSEAQQPSSFRQNPHHYHSPGNHYHRPGNNYHSPGHSEPVVFSRHFSNRSQMAGNVYGGGKAYTKQVVYRSDGSGPPITHLSYSVKSLRPHAHPQTDYEYHQDLIGLNTNENLMLPPHINYGSGYSAPRNQHQHASHRYPRGYRSAESDGQAAVQLPPIPPDTALLPAAGGSPVAEAFEFNPNYALANPTPFMGMSDPFDIFTQVFGSNPFGSLSSLFRSPLDDLFSFSNQNSPFQLMFSTDF